MSVYSIKNNEKMQAPSPDRALQRQALFRKSINEAKTAH
jgi:hypothetical protein